MDDADLFMECEEEELEPWQQLNHNDPDDSSGTAGSKSFAGAVTGVETPALSKPLVISSMPPASNNMSTVSLLTNTLPTAAHAGISKGAPGQQLILTQGAGGLTPVALSQVILPGSSAATSQPIYLTTQGIPVQNIQSGQSPMSIVLNVQQGQAVRPITLVQAPGAPGIFKPAVRTAQIITQQAPMRPATSVVNRAQPPGSFTAVQIPATLTIRTTAPTSQPRVKPVPSVLATQASTTPRAIPINSQTKIVTVKGGDGNLDVQNLMSFVNSVSLPAVGQPQTFVVMSNQKTNGAGSAAVQTAVHPAQNSIVQVTSAASLSHACPRCGAKFKMIEALRGHMCFCCPDMSRTASTDAPAAKPQIAQSKSLSIPVKSERMDVSPAEPQSRIVMLVDDFYYGTYEGNRVYVPSDNLKEPISFKCLTCGKKLKNNIRLMNHMKFHVDVEQQTGEVASHTSCPHCFRQFPTPYRLQYHVESVHNAIESTTRCKICEWAFDSEPVFLQHMKNTHKPGEMPYVCQVCQYRSSFYSDVHNHFRTWHEDTRYLLCIYCLKVFKHSSTYQQHFSRHQNSTVSNCNKCRLQFLFTKEKVEHKVNHHKTFRKPSQLEGLQAGTKVTIRAYAAQKKISSQMSSKTGREPTSTERDARTTQFGQTSSAHTLNTKLLAPQNTAAGKKQVSKMYDYLVKFQEHRAQLGRQKCVECTFDIPDFANHYPTYVHCSLCAYSTCCSRAYANHMINNHVPGRTHRGRSKKGNVSLLNLTCACCNYKTNQGDLMAKHLVQFPDHFYCVFFQKECLETDIEFCQVEEVEEEEEEEVDVEEPQEEGSSDETNPDWLSIESWRVPSDPGDGGSVPEFTDICGPQHLMAKSSDVLEYFQLLFPDALIDQIVHETNTYAKCRRSLGKGDPTWQPLTTEEVKGFIGLCILMGVQCLPELEMYWSWKHYHSCTTFYRTMSTTRFKQIRAHIRMNSMLAEEDNHPTDKLSVFQSMLKILESSMHKAYKPNKCLTIDQALLPAQDKGADRERCTDSLPRIWLLCDSKSGYCHKLLILTHQEKHTDLGNLVVPYLVEDIEGKNHQIFISNKLASVPLMMKMQKKNIYCSSSIPTNSSVVPVEFWRQSALESPGDFIQFEHPPVLFTRWKDAKEMICLSTNAVPGQPDTVWRKSTSKAGELSTISRPLAFKLLQDNMRGVDICNQLLACNQLGGLVLDTNWRRLFWFLVNLSVINSFIILRETRKGNPPGWLQGGHFSQADYRKRLGYQLAKCAEREALLKKIANDRMQQRKHEGNPKIGFVEPKRESTLPALDSRNAPRGTSVDESATSLEVSSVQDEDLDQELAPLEESDSDFETDDSSQQEPLAMEDEPTANETPAQPSSPKSNKEKEETLSVRQLRILLFALCSGIEKAAKDMDTKPQLIRAWLRDKETRLDSENKSGEAVERLVEWVLVQREQQHIINETNLFQKASEVHSQTNQSSSFRISYEWAVNFMLQHKLGLQRAFLSLPQLPRSLEENCLHFTGFVQRQIQMHNVPRSAVGAMDELSVFVDFDTLVDGTIISKEAAFQLEGSGKPWVNIYLSMLADGSMLPTVLFFKGTPFGSVSKRLPDSLLLEARVEGFSENEELDVWNNRVWQQHLNSQKGSKTILVMDGHHSHMSEGFVSTMSGTKTLPVIIPSGCTSQLQPLEICVRPVLKKFLLARWSKLANKGCVAEVTPEELVRLLATWLEEFLASCSGKPRIIESSFCLSRVIAVQEECKKEANTQVELINTLTEAVLGPEAVEPETLSEEESVETLAEDEVETNKNLTNEELPGSAKQDVEQTGTNNAGQAGEITETEQQAQKIIDKGLEASGATPETCSSLLPGSPVPNQVCEKEDLLETSVSPVRTLI
ncbi:hypothetical protein NFI96_011133 [Prochilodus magdalenae]|nr:hypothetical protein NFI96_011133 [Prochilodus magdalenae]